MIRSVSAALAAVLWTTVPALAITDAQAEEMLREMRGLRDEVRTLRERVATLEGGTVAPAPATADDAPSPDALGTPSASPAPGPASSGAASPGGRTGAQAQIGVVFDGIYTGGRHVADDAELRAVELNIGAPVDPYFDLFAKLNFTPGEVAIENGYVTSHLPWNLQSRIGLEWVPFGDVGTLDIDEHPQVDQPPVIAQFLGAEGVKALGGHIEWQAPFAANPTLALTFGAYNRATGDATTTATDKDGDGTADSPDMFLNEGAFNVRDRERGPLLLGRISSFASWGEDRHALRLGASWMGDENDASGATRTNVYGLDAKYRWTPDATGRGFILAGEFLQQHRRESPLTLFRANGGRDLSNRGGYAYGQYNFNKRWGLGYRYDNTNTVFSSENEIVSNSVYGEFRPSEFSRLRAQYRHDSRNFDTNGNGRTDPGDDADVAMLQFTHLIGWHPAHKF